MFHQGVFDPQRIDQLGVSETGISGQNQIKQSIKNPLKSPFKSQSTLNPTTIHHHFSNQIIMKSHSSHHFWLVVSSHLKNMSSSVGIRTFPTEWKVINDVPINGESGWWSPLKSPLCPHLNPYNYIEIS